MARKPGEPTSTEDRAKWSIERLVKETKKGIRTDWGGRDPTRKIIDELRCRYHNLDPMLALRLVPYIVEKCEVACEGSRERCFPNLDEILRRICGSRP